MDLTKRQQEIFDFIKRYSARHGYPPTVRDIGKAVGLASSSTVHQHLANLERIGLLKRDPSKPRAIEMLDRAVAEIAARRAEGTLRDYFFDRLMFPIRDAKGATIGFGGRTLGDGELEPHVAGEIRIGGLPGF